jgi:hypothetical protein
MPCCAALRPSTTVYAPLLVRMDSIDALVGGRPEVQAYLNHRFEASVKAGVAEATRRVHAAPNDDTADDATNWGLAQCACTQCDLVRRRTTHAPTGVSATRMMLGLSGR